MIALGAFRRGGRISGVRFALPRFGLLVNLIFSAATPLRVNFTCNFVYLPVGGTES